MSKMHPQWGLRIIDCDGDMWQCTYNGTWVPVRVGDKEDPLALSMVRARKAYYGNPLEYLKDSFGIVSYEFDPEMRREQESNNQPQSESNKGDKK